YEQEALIGTNRFVQVVFVNNINPDITNNVYFQGGLGFGGELPPVTVEWLTRYTNVATGLISTNYLYLVDDLGTRTNSALVRHDTVGLTGISQRPTFEPTNYFFSRSPAFFFL